MKTAAILLIILAIGLVVTGCSKTIPETKITTPTNTQAAANTVDDLTMDDTATTNPDIGTLDDTAVSEELPQ